MAAQDSGANAPLPVSQAVSGTYVVHAKHFGVDHGRYSIIGDQITFSSYADQRHNKVLKFALPQSTVMLIGIVAVVPYAVEWRRARVRPNFGTIAIDGRHIPHGLKHLMHSVLTYQAKPWRDDAVPTSLKVEELKNGHYRVVLDYFSPSTVETMQARVSAYEFTTTVHAGRRSLRRGLPTEFLDLPWIISAAKNAGVEGVLTKASLRGYQNYDAVWSISTTGRTGCA